MATPHNAANMGDIAETILLPGDTPEHIKERKYLSWELEWVCRLLAFTAMN